MSIYTGPTIVDRILSSGLLPTSPAHLSDALGISISTLRPTLCRALRSGHLKHVRFGLYDIGDRGRQTLQQSEAIAALQALKDRQAREASWPMDEKRREALKRAYSFCGLKRYTAAMAVDYLIDAMRYGIAPDDSAGQ